MANPKYPHVGIMIDRNAPEANPMGIIQKVAERIAQEVSAVAGEEYRQDALDKLPSSTYEEVIELAQEYVDLVMVD